jgi:hypothetical protein
MSDELLARDRMLAIRKATEMLVSNSAAQSPLFSQTANPLALHLLALGVISLFRVGELFGVVGEGLSCRDGF